MNMMAGEFFSASSNAFLRLDSDSPASLLIISGPLIRKKNAPVSLATARAISVLPVPEDKNNLLLNVWSPVSDQWLGVWIHKPEDVYVSSTPAWMVWMEVLWLFDLACGVLPYWAGIGGAAISAELTILHSYVYETKYIH